MLSDFSGPWPQKKMKGSRSLFLMEGKATPEREIMAGDGFVSMVSVREGR